MSTLRRMITEVMTRILIAPITNLNFQRHYMNCFYSIEFIILFFSTLVSHGLSIYILLHIGWNIQTLWCLRNESYITWLYIVYRRYWWSGKSLNVHIEFNNISFALFILFYTVPIVCKLGTNFWWRDIDFRLLNCILYMYIPSISSNLGFKVHDL